MKKIFIFVLVLTNLLILYDFINKPDARKINPMIPECDIDCSNAKSSNKKCSIPDNFTGNVCLNEWSVQSFINGEAKTLIKFDSTGVIRQIIRGKDDIEEYEFKRGFENKKDFPMDYRVYLSSETKGSCRISYTEDGNIYFAQFDGYTYNYRYDEETGIMTFEDISSDDGVYRLIASYYNNGAIESISEYDKSDKIYRAYYKNGSIKIEDGGKGYTVYYSEDNSSSFIRYHWIMDIIYNDKKSGAEYLIYRFTRQ